MSSFFVLLLAWLAVTLFFVSFAVRFASRILLQFDGQRAEGRLDRFESSGGDHPVTMAVYRFSPPGGPQLEFREEASAVREPGDPVLVRYWRFNPGRTATTVGRGGTWRPLFSNLLPLLVSGVLSGGTGYALIMWE